MDNLVASIYHEKQEEGSMMCAQHALNSLLQGNYFSATDLASIAKDLDSLEESYDDNNAGTRSTNMDDTGFFSIQVLEGALKVWNFGLTRWRSEEMRALHDHPETQLAFILNYEQHWFALRRFGSHWFNLNSFVAKPEWVSKTYLGMVLQQAEADGYSVFVVTPLDESTAELPHTLADDLGETIPEPTSGAHSNPHISTENRAAIAGMEDEDYELQAALQASLMGVDAPMVAPPPVIRGNVPLPEMDSPASTSAFATPPESMEAELDPVAASLERNKRRLDQMRMEQEYAQRQLREETGWSAPNDDEDEMLRRALEESGAAIQQPVAQNQHTPASGFGRDRVYDDDDAELQAALKASLEEVPVGWMPEEFHPVIPPQSAPSAVVPQAPPESVPASAPEMEEEDTDEVQAPVEALSADELRRRRPCSFRWVVNI
ncbi:Josephin domain-containing protein [Mycena kentingensis (nom. inval.)]|nr:Josephin domain-containing protein [Mycena kentingensis (nom. inval.)]